MALNYLQTILELDSSERDDIYCTYGYSRRWCDVAIDNNKVKQHYNPELSQEDIKWKKRSINNVFTVLEQLFLRDRTWLDVMHL